MAYPTGINWQARSGFILPQPIGETSSTRVCVLGQTVEAFDQAYGVAKFIYLNGAAGTEHGSVVAYNVATGNTVLATSASRGPVAVAMSANLSGFCGWYCISGAVPVKAPMVASNTSCYITSTAGQLGDTAGVIGLQVYGAKFVTADVAGFATVNLNSPSISVDAGGGGGSGITAFAEVGSSPHAAAATVSGTTATIQPADATHPGVLTTGPQTIAGAKTWSGAAVFGSTVAATGAVTGSNLSGTNTGDYSEFSSVGRVVFTSSGSVLSLNANKQNVASVALADTNLSLQVTFTTSTGSADYPVNATSRMPSGGGFIWYCYDSTTSGFKLRATSRSSGSDIALNALDWAVSFVSGR